MSSLPALDLHFLPLTPQFFERIWGGQRLRALFNYPIPPNRPIGEAWLATDRPEAISSITGGTFAGNSLHELIETFGERLLGSSVQLTPQGRFPLLLKLIDAADILSVQVHPSDADTLRLGESDTGKTEMWHVLFAEPGAELVSGLLPGVTRPDFQRVITQEPAQLETLLHSQPVHPGDTVFVPAGQVHAIGKGIVLAEIQQNSDLTYRVHDFGRIGPDGHPRQLHLEKAIDVIDFSLANASSTPSAPQCSGDARITQLASCPYFTAERGELNGACTRTTGETSFHLILGIEGTLTLASQQDQIHFNPGQTILIPAACETFTIQGTGAWLEFYVSYTRN